MDKKLYCGAAVVDITPPADMFPMPRGITPGSYFGGVLDPIHIRAIALSDGEQKALIVAFEMIGAPDPKENVKLISERTGIPEENIMYFAVHTHSAPSFGFFRRKPEREPDPKIKMVLDRYEDIVNKALLKVVDDAVASLKPARYGVGYGKSYVNINRNQDYHVEIDGKKFVKCYLGYNPDGPSDKTVAIIRFEDLDGKPIAFFVNYAVHAVVMHQNKCINGMMGISGDIPGVVCGYIEDKFPGAVAVWSSGAAGDQNPIMMNNIYFPDPKTGGFGNEVIENGDIYGLKVLAARHYADILRAIEKVGRTTDKCEIRCVVDWSYTPGRDVIYDDPTKSRVVFTEDYKVVTEGVAPYDVRLQLLRMGDVALLGASGEMFTSHALHLKAVSPLKNTIVVTHCSSGLARSGYLYDDDGIARKALWHNNSRILPGYLRDSLERVSLNMFEKALYPSE